MPYQAIRHPMFSEANRLFAVVFFTSAICGCFSTPPPPAPFPWWTPDNQAKTEWGQTIIPIAGTDNHERRADVVFIHGLNGNPQTTWESEVSPKFYLPAYLHYALDNEKFPVGVWSVNYDSAASNWLGKSMPVVDQSKRLLDELRLAGLGKKPIVFVAHSLGGILVKRMLMDADTLNDDGFETIRDASQSVIFVATPHSGSMHASLLNLAGYYLPGKVSSLAAELRDNDSTLRALNDWYRANADKLEIKTYAFFETQPLHGALIVDQASANPGLASAKTIGLPFDHIAICKPSKPSNLLCRELVDIVKTDVESLVIPNSMPMPEFLQQFNKVRDDGTDLETFKQKYKRNQFTWTGYVTKIQLSDKRRSVRLGASPDTPNSETAFLSFGKDDLSDNISVGSKIIVKGVFSKETNSLGVILDKCTPSTEKPSTSSEPSKKEAN